MERTLYQIDAFTSDVFRGNPAAVVPLDTWLPDEVMQAIAAENNLAETAFFVGGDGRFALRWFTPAVEVPLCGHATLASAAVLFEELGYSGEEIVFDTKSGPLTVSRRDGGYEMDLPARQSEPVDAAGAETVARALRARPIEVLRGFDTLAVFERAEDVAALDPDFAAVAQLPGIGVIATAPGVEHDFVSRFFAPGAGVNEDPATGAAHCALAPFWAPRIGKPRLRARQISARGGELVCEDRGDRISLWGQTALYLTGTIRIPSRVTA